jgi:hypothetical protein
LKKSRSEMNGFFSAASSCVLFFEVHFQVFLNDGDAGVDDLLPDLFGQWNLGRGHCAVAFAAAIITAHHRKLVVLVRAAGNAVVIDHHRTRKKRLLGELRLNGRTLHFGNNVQRLADGQKGIDCPLRAKSGWQCDEKFVFVALQTALTSTAPAVEFVFDDVVRRKVCGDAVLCMGSLSGRAI